MAPLKPLATAADLRRASEDLARRDGVIAGLVDRHGHCRLRPVERSRFEALARAIAYQQLAGRAAASIWGRVRALVDGPFTPEAVLALGEDALRGAGLSNAKMRSLLDLASKVAAGDVRLDRIGRLDDGDVVDHLVQVRGIGPWTAQMFLMFTLRRPDVWPTGDLGVRAGYAKAYGLPELPSPLDLDAFGERYRPYRSVAAWYCWRACETVTP
jgi:3-methyladenine DNA glycosylase/8-oxoguanine DNA glycosylase